jgi:spermidine/putrescine transport system ATP-binding protein
LFVRPEQLTLADAAPAANVIAARRVNEEFEGSIRTLYLNANGLDLRLYRMNADASGPALAADGAASVWFRPEHATVLPVDPSRSG